MTFRVLADATVVLHLAFILFSLFGGLLVLWRTRAIYLHLPAFAWSLWAEFGGATCPLTPLENWLRARGGEAAYGTGFIEHYLLPMIYPGALTREIQLVLGGGVLLVNALVYGFVLRRRRRAGAHG